MPRRTFTESEKRQLAQCWLATRTHGETQEKFAARHQTTARRVREYVHEFIADHPVERAREIIGDALERLQQLLIQLDGNLDRVDGVAPCSSRQLPTGGPLTTTSRPISGAPTGAVDSTTNSGTTTPPPAPAAAPLGAPRERYLFDLGEFDDPAG